MEKHRKWFVLAIVAFLNYLLFIGTCRYGLALEVDSANYFSAAQSLAKGNGFLQFDEFRYLNAPPLYPIVLSLGYLLGLPIQAYALVLHFFLFNGSLYFLFCILQKRLNLNHVPMYLFFAGGFYFNFFHVFLFALSEAGFVFLLLAWVNELLKEEDRSEVLLAVLLGLLCMQRYAIWLLLPGILIVWFKQKKKILWMLGQLLPALLFSGLWWYRNFLVSGTPFGQHKVEDKISLEAFGINLLRLFTGVLEHLNLFVPLLFFALILFLGSALHRKLRGKGREYVHLVIAMSSSYLILLLLQENISFIQMPRYLAVLWPLVLLIAAIYLDAFAWPTWTKVLLVMAFLVPQTILLQHHLQIKAQYGAGGYHSNDWMYWKNRDLEQKIPEGKLVSNYPDMVWWITDRHCEYTPFKDENKVDYYQRVERGKILIWFRKNERKHVMNMDFRNSLPVEQIYALNACEVSRIK
ncbi:MAG: hypothetical protein CFE21_04735 [Bacteroidetes bacterium B1(2017)]|nr:MAG: hypothetical protein CFE21_04735 [Bacteroidetes bacterium B1(2017)]